MGGPVEEVCQRQQGLLGDGRLICVRKRVNGVPWVRLASESAENDQA